MPTVFDAVNKVMVRSGYSQVSSGQISTLDTFANKAFICFQLAWDTFIASNPSWSFNEPEASAALDEGDRSITMPTTVNANFIDHVYVTDSNDKKYSLNQTGWEKVEKENNFLDVDALTSTPSEWYLENEELKFNRFADQDYTVYIIGQKLPEEFDPTETETTNLPIDRTAYETVINMALYRLQELKRDNKAESTWEKTENLASPTSKLRQTIARNKLKEKQNTRRIRFKKGPSDYS